MSIAGFAFLIVAVVFVLLLPRHLAAFPLCVAACYMTLAQRVVVGSFSLPVIRLVILAGLLRIVLRRERLAGGMNRLDRAVVAFGIGALVTALFHADLTAQLVNSLGLVFNVFGTYFLIRCFCASEKDVPALVKMVAFILVPVALEMLFELGTGRNLFAVLGGVEEFSTVREGRIRAQGPFAHPILAGTVGAVCMPMFVGIWRNHRAAAVVGLLAATVMVLSCASSGPLGSVAAGAGGLVMWKYRDWTRQMRWAAVAAYLGLMLVMKAPPYFLLARIDLIGGSTGWHRAELIRSALAHLGEWWLWGTDYTRHWMPTGVSWSPDHADITNHYLQMGVIGGLPLMVLFIWILVTGFSFVGEILRQHAGTTREDSFMVWTLGVALFAHAVGCISVTYFDQSFVFLYINVALIGAVWAQLNGLNITAMAKPGHSASRRQARLAGNAARSRFGRRRPAMPGSPSHLEVQTH